MQSMAPSSVSGTHTTTCMRTLHQTRAAGLHPPTGSMQTLRRPSQSAELVLDAAQLVLDMLPPLEDCVQRGA